jgi:hypothetical protein
MSQWAQLRKEASKLAKKAGTPKKQEKVSEMMIPTATLNIIAESHAARLRNLAEAAISTQTVTRARREIEKGPEKKIGRRPISAIALDILRDWKKPNYAAVPYLEAMLQLGSIDDQYGYDSAYSVVAYFLSNASSWRGPVAKEIKKELKGMMKKSSRQY